MAFDYKKEYKEFYLPPQKPGLIMVPEMQYVAVRGRGNPNEPEGDYKKAMGTLYHCIYDQNELQRFPQNRGVFLLCSASPGRVMAAGGDGRNRLHKKERTGMVFHDPAPGICHTGRVHMGEERSGTKERDRRFQGRVFSL